MFNCPKCNELLNYNVKICPFCRTDVSKKAAEAEKAFEAEIDNEEEMILNVFKRKRIIYFIVCIAFVLIGLIICLIASNSDNLRFFAGSMIAIALGTLVLIVLGIVSGAMICPYCGRLLYRNHLYYCGNCGKRIW